MIIGINAAAAFKEPRTGVEEYCYQIIKNIAMLEESKKHRFVLYIPRNLPIPDGWILPDNFEYKFMHSPLAWTQFRLSLEMIRVMPSVLFIPVHVLPIIHPFNSVVTLHGLEYEQYPQMYPNKVMKYLRWSTKFAVKRAKTIIAVSEKTKKDLIDKYGVSPEKIEVIYHGVDYPKKITKERTYKYILYVGRLEIKKNIFTLIEAFEILKRNHKIPHKLVLVGPEGFGFDQISRKINSSPSKDDIFITGYLPSEEKIYTLRNASVFAWPSFYEGFGLPMLEAMSNGVPLVASDIEINREIAKKAAAYFSPRDSADLAAKIMKIITNPSFKRNLVQNGRLQAKKFSWQRAAKKTLRVLTAL